LLFVRMDTPPCEIHSMENFDPNEALHKILHETEGNRKMAMQLCQQLMEKNNELEDKMEDLTIQFELMLQKKQRESPISQEKTGD